MVGIVSSGRGGSCLVAPSIPAFAPLTGKQLQIGASDELLDASCYFVGLAAVYGHRSHDELMHICPEANWLTFSCEQTKLRVGRVQ